MIVRVDTATRTLTAGADVVACAIGRGGACTAAAKREGDGCTPLGIYRLRAVLLRPDRVAAPTSGLPWRWLRADDGWSDDPRDPAYNRPVRHPHRFSAERMWRDDGAYYIVVVIGYNDTPVVASAGSAIFLHCSQPGNRPTAGCVAVAEHDLLAILPRLGPSSTIQIV